MKPEILHRKLERYITGKSMPAETKQIQTWLSCTSPDKPLTPEEKSLLGIRNSPGIAAHTAYPLFYPKKKKAGGRRSPPCFNAGLKFEKTNVTLKFIEPACCQSAFKLGTS